MSIKNVLKRLKGCRDNKADINLDELNEIMKSYSNAILLDVRSPQEFNEGHINRCN